MKEEPQVVPGSREVIDPRDHRLFSGVIKPAPAPLRRTVARPGTGRSVGRLPDGRITGHARPG